MAEGKPLRITTILYGMDANARTFYPTYRQTDRAGSTIVYNMKGARGRSIGYKHYQA